MISLPAKPKIVSGPPKPKIVSTPAVPLRESGPEVPILLPIRDTVVPPPLVLVPVEVGVGVVMGIGFKGAAGGMVVPWVIKNLHF
jgi:hypothetical protein